MSEVGFRPDYPIEPSKEAEKKRDVENAVFPKFEPEDVHYTEWYRLKTVGKIVLFPISATISAIKAVYQRIVSPRPVKTPPLHEQQNPNAETAKRIVVGLREIFKQCLGDKNLNDKLTETQEFYYTFLAGLFDVFYDELEKGKPVGETLELIRHGYRDRLASFGLDTSRFERICKSNGLTRACAEMINRDKPFMTHLSAFQNLRLMRDVFNRYSHGVSLHSPYKEKIDSLTQLLEQQIAKGQPTEKTIKKIQHQYAECLQKSYRISKQEFFNQLHIARGKDIPPTLSRSFVIQHSHHPLTLSEETERVDLDHSLGYLEARAREIGQQTVDPAIQASIAHLKTKPGTRVSKTKNGDQFQGVTVNGHEHRIVDPTSNRVLGVVYRSGAFALHGWAKQNKQNLLDQLNQELHALQKEQSNNPAKPNIEKDILLKKEEIAIVKKRKDIGIYKLEKELKKLEALDKARTTATTNAGDLEVQLFKKLHKLGFRNLDDMRSHLSARRDLAIAQALPKIVKSIERMANTPEDLAVAVQAGAFLHVEESLLSTLQGSERRMAEDMAGAMQYLTEKATIEFSDRVKKTSILLKDGRIVIQMPRPKGYRKDALSQFNLQALYFNTGINGLETVGLWNPRASHQFQPEVNADGLTKLGQYTQSVIAGLTRVGEKEKMEAAHRIEEAWKQLQSHYSSKGSRAVKDIEGMQLRRNLVKVLHAGQGIVCKSGKDRTAMKVTHDLAEDAASILDIGKSGAKKIQDRLFRGISYTVTGINQGQSPAYAISELQRPFFGVEEAGLLLPPSELCASGEA